MNELNIFYIHISEVECQADELHCSGRDGCYTTEQICDGILDCPSGSDEHGCCKFNLKK